MGLSGEMLAIAMAAISGGLMALQGSMNSALSKAVGLLEATMIVHITGTIFVIILLFVLRLGNGNFLAITQVPWYLYLGGIIGVGIIYLVTASIPVVGVANATTAIIIGQLLVAIVIDYIGAFQLGKVEFGFSQLAGVILLAIGARLLLRLG